MCFRNVAVAINRMSRRSSEARLERRDIATSLGSVETRAENERVSKSSVRRVDADVLLSGGSARPPKENETR